MSSYSLSISNQSQSPSRADMHEPHAMTQANPVLTSSKDRDFSLDCSEYQWLLEPPEIEPTSDPLLRSPEQLPVSASFSAPTSPTYAAHLHPGEWWDLGYRHASPSSTSLTDQHAVHSSIPIDDDPRQPAGCIGSTPSIPSSMTTPPKNRPPHDSFIDPVQLVNCRPIAISITPHHHQYPASHRPDIQNGELGRNQTYVFNRPTAGFVTSSEARNLVELNEDHGKEYGRSEPAGGPADLSQVNVSPPENAATMEDQLDDIQPRESYETLNRKFSEAPLTESHPLLAPSPLTTSTSTSASEGSRSPIEASSSLPTSPEPFPPSPPIRPPSAASSSSAGLSSSSSSSSSSSHESPKQKRENDEPSLSSSAPAKAKKSDGKSKSKGPSMKQGTRRPPAVLVLRHVPVDPSVPKPEDEFREYTIQGRIRPW